jgi:carboxyl-terminal processing protease
VKRKTLSLASVGLATASVLAYGTTSVLAATTGKATPRSSADRPPACAPPTTPTPPAPTATTVTTIEQAYYCIFDNYFNGPLIDDRSLLVPAFAEFTRELQRRGLDRPEADPPALTGDRDADWAAFAAVYQRVTERLPADPAVRQAVAEAAMHGMVNSLHDDHTSWGHGLPVGNALGISVSGTQGNAADPASTAPLFVTSLLPDSPPIQAGVRPGDEIVSVNDVPPFVNGVLVQGVLDWLLQAQNPVKLTLHRPSDNRTFTVTVTPGGPSGPVESAPSGPVASPSPRPGAHVPSVTAKLLPGDIAYVQIPDFFTGRGDEVLAAIANLGKGRTLHGVVIDIRGNTGGSPDEVAKLLGAWAHNKAFLYTCDAHNKCTVARTSDSVPLLNLPLVTLTDRDTASAGDFFAAAVKDLHLGKLVGTRTSGMAAGDGRGFVLDDGSQLGLTVGRGFAANKEIISSIGVAPDYKAPMTAAALSAGRDPAVEKSLALLR